MSIKLTIKFYLPIYRIYFLFFLLTVRLSTFKIIIVKILVYIAYIHTFRIVTVKNDGRDSYRNTRGAECTDNSYNKGIEVVRNSNTTK